MGSHTERAGARLRSVVTVLRGSVETGPGLLAPRMRQHADVYTRLTGTVLYPGSLNVLRGALPERDLHFACCPPQQSSSLIPSCSNL